MAALGAREVTLAGEEEFENLFPDCETGAMPPFGNLYEMDTYVDTVLKEDDEITFNAGTHAQVIRMTFDDYEVLDLVGGGHGSEYLPVSESHLGRRIAVEREEPA